MSEDTIQFKQTPLSGYVVASGAGEVFATSSDYVGGGGSGDLSNYVVPNAGTQTVTFTAGTDPAFAANGVVIDSNAAPINLVSNLVNISYSLLGDELLATFFFDTLTGEFVVAASVADTVGIRLQGESLTFRETLGGSGVYFDGGPIHYRSLIDGATSYCVDTFGGVCDRNFSSVVNSWSIRFNGVQAMNIASTGLGFYQTAPQGQQTISGSRGGNVALGNLLFALANLGLIVDATT